MEWKVISNVMEALSSPNQSQDLIPHTDTQGIKCNYTPRFNKVETGVYWFHLVRPSIRPWVDRIVSTLYLQQYLPDPFHKIKKIGSFVKFFKFVTLTLLCFHLGSKMSQWYG